MNDTSGTVPSWDPRYRRLRAGETILSSDECQRDDGSWVPAVCVGGAAPDPNYTSHRVYRRLSTGAVVAVEQIRQSIAKQLAHDPFYDRVILPREQWDALLAALASAPAGDGVEAERWRERWYGSPPEKGSAIVTERGTLVCYLGGDEQTHQLATSIVSAHNAAQARPREAVGDDDVGLAEAARGLVGAHKRLGAAVAFRLDLWACLEANLAALQSPAAKVEGRALTGRRNRAQCAGQPEHRPMDHETDDAIRLNTAIARLTEFADTYPDGEQIDGDMKLTVDDVRLVIEAAKRGAKVVAVRRLDLSGPLPDDLTR